MEGPGGLEEKRLHGEGSQWHTTSEGWLFLKLLRCLFEDESESGMSVISWFVSSRFVIVDQSSGICDQGNKPKHVILPKFQ